MSVVFLGVIVLALSACGARPAAQQAGGTVIATRAPAAWDLTSPEAAVRSYLAWVSHAYREADSDLASPTMGPTETVRVDSYVQLNRQKGRGIDQTLGTFRVTGVRRAGSAATVATYEEWAYRYFDIADPGSATSGLEHAAYDATYTVTRGEDGLWRVEGVDATARGDVR